MMRSWESVRPASNDGFLWSHRPRPARRVRASLSARTAPSYRSPRDARSWPRSASAFHGGGGGGRSARSGCDDPGSPPLRHRLTVHAVQINPATAAPAWGSQPERLVPPLRALGPSLSDPPDGTGARLSMTRCRQHATPLAAPVHVFWRSGPWRSDWPHLGADPVPVHPPRDCASRGASVRSDPNDGRDRLRRNEGGKRRWKVC